MFHEGFSEKSTGLIFGGTSQKRLMGMCHWMGSLWHNWIDSNAGCILSRNTGIASQFFWDLEGKKILVRKDLKMGRFAVKNSCIGQKLSKMGSIIGHKIDFNVVGVLRGQRHIPRKNWPNYPPPPKKKQKQKTKKQTKKNIFNQRVVFMR